MTDNVSGKSFLVTGGTGFIGSHFVVCLLEAGAKVMVVDDFSNSSKMVLDRINIIVGKQYKNLKFYEVDLRQVKQLEKVFIENRLDGVIHFAAKKAVGESIEKPLLYYDVNIVSTINLLNLMQQYKVNQMVFSSSCTVYGVPKKVPVDEQHPRAAISPYGRTKLYMENIMEDCAFANKDLKIMLLRYFNPVGAHPSGLIGEQPRGIPNNLMPFIQQVATGQRPELKIFGGDYPTRDGTCIRDYVHVCDLARGHIIALNKLDQTKDYGCQAVNLGTGTGTSVLELVHAFEKASKVRIKYQIVEKRSGDTVETYCDTTKSNKELGFQTKFNVEDMCYDQWRWAKLFPNGFDDLVTDKYQQDLQQYNQSILQKKVR